MATQLENDSPSPFNESYFQHALPSYYRATLRKLQKIARSTTYLHLFFPLIVALEGLAFSLSFSSLKSPLTVAIFLCSFILTTFSYLILLFYFHAKKPEQLLQLKEEFIRSCSRLLSTPAGTAGHHLLVAESASRLSQYLHDYEWGFYKLPSFLQGLSPYVSYLSAFFHYEDIFNMKTWLLKASVEEHLKQIRIMPTDLEVHASLASTYVSLAKLFKNPASKEGHPKASYVKKVSGELEEKSKMYSHLAIEEFKILSHYAVDDPWVHEQMASGYKSLGLVNEEIQEMEILLKLRPQDKEILHRLGTLYFAQGLNAKGLQVYEGLKQTNYKKAEDLIASYGLAKTLDV